MSPTGIGRDYVPTAFDVVLNTYSGFISYLYSNTYQESMGVTNMY